MILNAGFAVKGSLDLITGQITELGQVNYLEDSAKMHHARNAVPSLITNLKTWHKESYLQVLDDGIKSSKIIKLPQY